MADFLLPLFPLQLVLFPRTNLALHIFEERYKLMIRECLDNRWEFGIVLVKETSIASVGCTASIENILRKYADGRMDIVVRGQRRFEVLQLDRQKPYTRCECRMFDDDDESPESKAEGEEWRDAAWALYQELRRKLPAAEQAQDEPALDRPKLDSPELDRPELDRNDPQLSFQITARLPPDLAFRQSLLALHSETERLGRLLSYLQKLEIVLARAAQARTKASSNGRAH